MRSLNSGRPAASEDRIREDRPTASGYFVQAYKAKGTRLVGQPTEGYGDADEALAAAGRLARWRAGIVVFRQGVDDDGRQRGRPAVLAVHGTVPGGWLLAERAAA